MGGQGVGWDQQDSQPKPYLECDGAPLLRILGTFTILLLLSGLVQLT